MAIPVSFLLLVVAVPLALLPALGATGAISRLLWLALVPVFGLALGQLAVILITRPLRRAVRREMTDLGVPICIGCGYNLTGLACQHSARADVHSCPECGELLPGS